MIFYLLSSRVQENKKQKLIVWFGCKLKVHSRLAEEGWLDWIHLFLESVFLFLSPRRDRLKEKVIKRTSIIALPGLVKANLVVGSMKVEKRCHNLCTSEFWCQSHNENRFSPEIIIIIEKKSIGHFLLYHCIALSKKHPCICRGFWQCFWWWRCIHVVVVVVWWWVTVATCSPMGGGEAS